MATTNRAERPIKPLFPQLTGGPSRMKPDQVARHQKARLQGAMIAAVARHGFASTTLRELVTLAGVSKSTFYEHFESKEACFLSTFDLIVDQLTAEVRRAYEEPEDFREKLTAALRRYMQLVLDEPDAASFASIDVLTLGSAGVSHRERSWEPFEEIAREHFASSGQTGNALDLTVRAVIAGISGVVYRRLRAGKAEELPDLVEPLIDWALSYPPEDSEPVLTAMRAAEAPAPPPPVDPEREGLPDWSEPPDSPRSRSSLSQRERIIRAAARVVVDRGYDALSIPAISAAAGTSNQTFYENFNSKRDAFLAAYEMAAADALRVSLAAFNGAPAGPEAIGIGLRALLEYISSHELYARLAFFELPTAGPPALDRADRTMNLLTSFLEPERAPKGIGGPAPRVMLEATGAGIWSVVQREIAHGRRETLPQLSPELTRIALAPLNAHARQR
ncbi:MAG: TetR/AcrR family transcriptional regulator [Methanosarcina sp.]